MLEYTVMDKDGCCFPYVTDVLLKIGQYVRYWNSREEFKVIRIEGKRR